MRRNFGKRWPFRWGSYRRKAGSYALYNLFTNHLPSVFAIYYVLIIWRSEENVFKELLAALVSFSRNGVAQQKSGRRLAISSTYKGRIFQKDETL